MNPARIADTGNFGLPAWQTRLEIEEDIRSGPTTTVDYEGSYNEVLAKRFELLGSGATRFVTSPKGDGNWLLRASFPWGPSGPEPPNSVHELEVSVAQRSFYAAGPVTSALTPAQIAVVANCLNLWKNETYSHGAQMAQAVKGVWSNPPDPTVQEFAEDDLTNHIAVGGAPLAFALRLFRVLIRGDDSFLDYNTVYRRTITAATPGIVKAVYTGAGKIWTTAEVNTFEGIDPNGWFVLDTGMQWLKSRPVVQAATNQKTQISYNYEAAYKWSSVFYEAYATAVLADL